MKGGKNGTASSFFVLFALSYCDKVSQEEVGMMCRYTVVFGQKGVPVAALGELLCSAPVMLV